MQHNRASQGQASRASTLKLALLSAARWCSAEQGHSPLHPHHPTLPSIGPCSPPLASPWPPLQAGMDGRKLDRGGTVRGLRLMRDNAVQATWAGDAGSGVVWLARLPTHFFKHTFAAAHASHSHLPHSQTRRKSPPHAPQTRLHPLARRAAC